MTAARSHAHGRRRRGTTFVELIVAILVLALVAGAAAGTLARQQRAARAAAEIRAVHADMRDAAVVLAGELRGAALQDTLRLAADTAIEFFAPLLAAVSCAPSQSARVLLRLPHRAPATFAMPDTGDLVWLWREDSIIPPGRWLRARVASLVAAPADACDEHFAGTVLPPHALTLAEDLEIPAGTLVQFVRRGRYSIYRAADNAWYLGYRRCDAAGPPRCQTVQPVAGPYRTRSGGIPGIQFRYFDSIGAELPAAVAPWAAFRVDIVVRSDTANAPRRAPGRRALSDSVLHSIALRNVP